MIQMIYTGTFLNIRTVTVRCVEYKQRPSDKLVNECISLNGTDDIYRAVYHFKPSPYSMCTVGLQGTVMDWGGGIRVREKKKD
jgi:hypothetical protein